MIRQDQPSKTADQCEKYLGGSIQDTRHETTDRKGKILISRLRTGHVRINQYLERISKAVTDMCECGVEEQTVEHILVRCALTEEAREKSTAKLGGKMDLRMLLYSQEGLEETVRIWSEFEQARKEIKERQRESEKEGGKERWWGWGEVERV